MTETMPIPQMSEQQRQTNALTQAIDRAISETMADFQQPMINAIASALAYNLAEVFSAIPDQRARKGLRKAFDAALPAMMAQAALRREQGLGGFNVEIVDTGKRRG